MRFSLLLTTALVVCGAARGQSGPTYVGPQNGAISVVATGGLTADSLADRAAVHMNVKNDFGAYGNALTFGDAQMTAGSSVVYDPSATFTAADIGKSAIMTGCTSGGASTAGTITAYTDSHHVSVSFTCSVNEPNYKSLIATDAASGSGYVPGDTLIDASATGLVPATLLVGTTKVTTVAVASGGTGGTNGACTVTGTTGTGQSKFSATGTITSNSLSGSLVVANGGVYLTNPSSLSAEPVTGCNLTGATVSIGMGVGNIRGDIGGVYLSAPSGTWATTSSGAGTGATITPGSTQWGGILSYGADDTSAFTNAVNWANTNAGYSSGVNIPVVLNIPAGYYLISSALPTFYHNVSIIGDGSTKSIIRISPAMSGDLFSWSDAWLASTIPFDGNTEITSTQSAGPFAHGLKVVGDRTSTSQQNAFMLYDHDDLVLFDDLEVHTLNGRVIGSGIEKNDSSAYTRESRFHNIRQFQSGGSGVPCFEFTSQGGGDGSNEIEVNNLRGYGCYGIGLLIRNQGTGGVRGFRMADMSLEGLEGSPVGVGDDLLRIGDTGTTNAPNDITANRVNLVDPYLSAAAVRVTGGAGSNQPYFIDFSSDASQVSAIAGGLPYGDGLHVDAGRNSRFSFNNIDVFGTGVTVGAVSAGVGAGLFLNGDSLESSWSYNIDSTSLSSVLTLPQVSGNPSVPTTLGFTVNRHDNSAIGGAPIAAGAIDMQLQRNLASQIASGPNSLLFGGAYNTANASVATVIGGSSNTSCAIGGSIVGSSGATDRCRVYSQAYATGEAEAYTQASSQAGRQALYGSGSSAIRLTAYGLAASSSFGPILNIPNNAAFNLTVRLVAIDRTTPANSYAWTMPMSLLTRQASVGTTAIVNGSPTTTSTGTGSTSSVSLTADATYGGINLTFTPPSGADTWDAFADVWSSEVQ